MIRECSFILPSSRKCRCAATRNLAVCRHHAPKPAVPGPRPIPKRERYSNLIRWRELGSNLQWMPVTEIPHAIFDILESLIDRGPNSSGPISDLTAGRYLRVLLNRLGDVPFTDPDFAAQPAVAPAPAPVLDPRELEALLAALGAPASSASVNQTRARVNQ